MKLTKSWKVLSLATKTGKAASMKLSFLFLLPILFSCSGNNTGKGYRLSKIDAREIEIAEIKKSLYDTISVELNKQQVSTLARTVSGAPTDLRKALPNYWIFVRLKNDSIICYKVLDHYIGEKDLYVETARAVYFKKLYETSKKSTSLIPLKLQ